MTDQELWDAAVKQVGTELISYRDTQGALVFRTPQEFADCFQWLQMHFETCPICDSRCIPVEAITPQLTEAGMMVPVPRRHLQCCDSECGIEFAGANQINFNARARQLALNEYCKLDDHDKPE